MVSDSSHISPSVPVAHSFCCCTVLITFVTLPPSEGESPILMPPSPSLVRPCSSICAEARPGSVVRAPLLRRGLPRVVDTELPIYLETDTIIERLIRTAIETAAVGAIFCVGIRFSERFNVTDRTCGIGRRCDCIHDERRYESPLLLRLGMWFHADVYLR